MTRHNLKESRTCLDMETIWDIFIDAIKLAGELLNQDTSLDIGKLDTIIHRYNILLGILDEIITDFQLQPPFKDNLKQLIARLITWRGHASIHLELNCEDNRKRYTGKPGRPAYDMLVRAILSREVTVQREKLRKSIERVDPVRKVIRCLRTLRGRSYNVSTPISL